MLCGQRRQGGTQLGSVFILSDGLRGLGLAVGEPGQELLAGVCFCRRQRTEGHGPGTKLARQLLVTMQQDGIEPGGEPAGAVEAGDTFPGFNERLGGEVLGGRGIPAEGDGLLKEALLVGLRDRAKRIRVSLARSPKEFPRLRFTELCVRICHLSLNPHGREMVHSFRPGQRFALTANPAEAHAGGALRRSAKFNESRPQRSTSLGQFLRAPPQHAFRGLPIDARVGD
jgi:hypothetical protein